jgi:hypothetical protein
VQNLTHERPSDYSRGLSGTREDTECERSLAQVRGFAATVCEPSLVWKLSRLLSGTHEYFVVLVTSCFRYLASAPKVHWRSRSVT